MASAQAHASRTSQAKPRNIRLISTTISLHINGIIRSTINGLHLVSGPCDGVMTGADTLDSFPLLYTPSYRGPRIHGVNVHGSESRNEL